MHIAEVVTIAKSLPLLRLNTYKSLILSYSADYRRIFSKNTYSFKCVNCDIYAVVLIWKCLQRYEKIYLRQKFSPPCHYYYLWFINKNECICCQISYRQTLRRSSLVDSQNAIICIVMWHGINFIFENKRACQNSQYK